MWDLNESQYTLKEDNDSQSFVQNLEKLILFFLPKKEDKYFTIL